MMPQSNTEGTDMQSAACLNRILRWRRLGSLVAFVAWCGIGLIAAPATCVAEQSPTESANRFNGTRSGDKTAVFIVDEKECKTKVPKPPEVWTEPERWAWEQICEHLNVDFDEREANAIVNDMVNSDSPKRDGLYQQTLREIRARNTSDPEKLAKDGSRRLSGDFLAKIIGDPEFRHHTWNEPLRLFGFNTDRFVIDNAALKSLDIRNAHVGRFLIQNTTIDGGLRLENVRLASTKVHLVAAKGFLLNNVSVAATNFGLVRLGPRQPSFKLEERDGALNIDTARFEDRLAILEGDYDAIDLKHVKVDDLFFYYPAWNRCRESGKPELSISESVDNGVFTLEVNRRGVLPNQTKLNQLGMSELLDNGFFTLEVNAKDTLPKQIKLNQFVFANAYLGSDPMPVISAMDTDAKIATNGHPDLEPYTLIAKSYAERGETRISDRVLIAKNHQDWYLAKRPSLEFIWLTVTWLVAVYGFHPELGFAWIGGFVLIGWVIFWYASDRLAAGSYKPRNTFLLALDSVIPGIQLDRNHQDVRYDGWPQIMLYVLRILGAALVFVAFFYLQKKLLG
jgi:hypothetical protein